MASIWTSENIESHQKEIQKIYWDKKTTLPALITLSQVSSSECNEVILPFYYTIIINLNLLI